MATELITGLGDEPHVDAGDVGGFQAGIVGVEDYVLPAGEQMKATVISNNKIRIAEGEAVMQGRHWRIKPNTYEDVTIENGAQNMNRKDAIIARYTKNADTGIEKVELAVLKGTPTSGTAIAPAQEKGNILEGTMKHEMLLYIVSLKGLNIESVTEEFNVLMNMSKINKSLLDLSLKGKSVQTGNYGKQWKINQTDYYSIGGKELLNQDSELYTTRESKITVKKPSTYLAILHSYAFSTSGGGTLWAKITVNNAERLINAARCQGYAGVDLCGILNLNAGDIVDGLLSATGDITSEGKDTFTLIRL